MLSIVSSVSFLCLWCAFAVIIFRVLQALNPERFFKQGKVLEIRLFYIIITFTLSYLTAEAVMSLFNLFGLNF